MRNIVLTGFLLFLTFSSIVGQDVIVRGSSDFKNLCKGNALPMREGWTVVKKNLSPGALSPEIWCGIARINKINDSYEATLAYGPTRCDDMWMLSDGLVVYCNGSRFSAACLVDGKWKQTLKNFNCKMILCGRSDGAVARMLVRGKDDAHRWIDQSGKHLAGTPEHYENTIVYWGKDITVAVKSEGKWGVMTPDARVAVPIRYDTLFLTAPLREWGGKWDKANWFFVKKNGLWGVHGDNGTEAIPLAYRGLSYWPTAPETWCYRLPGGKWGIKDTDGRQILREEYDGLSPYSFNVSVSGSLRLPFAIIAGKGKGRALLNHKGRELLPYTEDADFFDMLVMFYPQKSFSVFTWNRYKLWDKGEFESGAEFEARKKDPSMNAGYVASLLPASEKAFTSAIIGDKPRLILSRYDADTECFLFSVDKILQDTYRIRVPRADAPLFKEEFESFAADALATAKYFIHNDMLALRSISFLTPEGKTFIFENPAAKGYTGPSLKDLDLIR